LTDASAGKYTVAQSNVADVSLATTAAIATVAGGSLGPEAIAAYKAAQAAYSLTTAAGAYSNYRNNEADFVNNFDQRFSYAGLAAAATVGAYTNMFVTSMLQWTGVRNSIQRLTTIPGTVIQGNNMAIGQAAGSYKTSHS
jgi:filamentous hemagglutinin